MPHRLYGMRPAAQSGSVAWWREQALAEMAARRQPGGCRSLTGGTGAVFRGADRGPRRIPDPAASRAGEARALLAEGGPVALHAALAEVDSATAARLRPSDGQRVARAWEVWRGSGRAWPPGRRAGAAPAPWRFFAILLDPPRDGLRAAIATPVRRHAAAGRAGRGAGAAGAGLDPRLPAMRAHGVPELSAYLRGEMTLAEAARRAELVTGQYTKRQATWFRHHALADTGHAHTINARFAGLAQFSESERADLFTLFKSWVDAPASSGLSVAP